MLRMEVLRPTLELATLARCEVSTFGGTLRWLVVVRDAAREPSPPGAGVEDSSLCWRLGE